MDIIASGGGMNWCWYHWFTIDDAARTAHQTRADRFHRWDERQGAKDHPATEYWFDVFRAPKDDAEYIATWGADRVAQWRKDWLVQCERNGLPPDTKAMLHLYRRDETKGATGAGKIYALI